MAKTPTPSVKAGAVGSSGAGAPARLSERPLVVTAAIICRHEEFLIAQRLPDAKLEAGKWEFPGGKLEFAEHPEEGLKREILEELGIEIEVGRLYEVVSHVYRGKERTAHIVLLCYLCKFKSGEVRHLDVADSRWIRCEQLADYAFAEADKPIVARLLAP